MKSLDGSGSMPHFCLLAPSPTPNQPPDASAYLPCSGCQPDVAACACGSTKLVIRSSRYGASDDQDRHDQADEAQHADEQAAWGAGHPQQREEDREQHQRGPQVVPDHDKHAQNPRAWHERHEQMPPFASAARSCSFRPAGRRPRGRRRAWRTPMAGAGYRRSGSTGSRRSSLRPTPELGEQQPHDRQAHQRVADDAERGRRQLRKPPASAAGRARHRTAASGTRGTASPPATASGPMTRKGP